MIDRYGVEAVGYWEHYLDDEGDYVLYEDHLAAVAEAEQRVNDEWVRDYGGHRAFALGVQAARDAVAARFRSRENGTRDRDEDWDNAIDAALVAIDALKENYQ